MLPGVRRCGPENKDIALEKYAQVAMNTDAEQQARAIRIRAERKAGQILATMDKAKGGGDVKLPKNQRSPGGTGETLADLGISKNQSSKWQRLASIPNMQFEKAMSDPDKKPSTAGMTKRNGTTDRMDPAALDAWGKICAWERDRLFDRDPNTITGELTDPMFDDLRRIIPMAIDWLKQLEKACYE